MLHRSRRFALALLSVASLALLPACAEDTGPGVGTLSVVLTDAPFPFDSVERADLHVVRVDARLAEPGEQHAAQDADGSDNGTDPASGWVTVATPDRLVNLLDLQRGVVTDLGAATIPTGRYRGFRLILDTDRSTVTLVDGTVLRGNAGIVFPSAGRTGIKVNLRDAIRVTGDSTVLVLDFDLGSSFVLRGNGLAKNGLLFKPVIRAMAYDVTGALVGTVRSASTTGAVVPDAAVEVLRAGTAVDDTLSANVIGTATTDAAGTFRFGFLLPGSYSLRATPPSALAATLGPVVVHGITVTTGQDANGGTLVLPAR